MSDKDNGRGSILEISNNGDKIMSDDKFGNGEVTNTSIEP